MPEWRSRATALMTRCWFFHGCNRPTTPTTRASGRIPSVRRDIKGLPPLSGGGIPGHTTATLRRGQSVSWLSAEALLQHPTR